jgi:outer membrane protein assembly factor BamB
MYAFDATDGHQIWRTVMLGEYYFNSPPTAYKGMVYTGGAGVGGYVYGVRETDGAVLWQESVLNGSNSSPAVTSGGVYVSYPCPQTYKFAPLTGFYLWHWNGPCEGGGGSTPVLYQGLLYVRDALFISKYDNALVFNSTSGTVASYFNSYFVPVFWNGTAFYSQATGLTAVSLTSGKTVWSAAPPSGDSYSISPIVVNGILYIGTKLGTLLGYKSGTGVQAVSIPMGAPMKGDDLAIETTPLAGLGAAQGLLVVPASSYLVALAP